MGPLPLTAAPRRAITPLKQQVPSRSPTVTPPVPQQGAANMTQLSLVGMTKEEKAAEMTRRKEERKQVSGAIRYDPCYGRQHRHSALLS